MREYFQKWKSSREDAKVQLYISDYAAKGDLKNGIQKVLVKRLI